MPMYHLHLINAHIDADDSEGHNLPDLESAKAKAIEGIRGFLSHEVVGGKMDFRGHIDIEDDNGTILERVPFSDAIALIGLILDPHVE